MKRPRPILGMLQTSKLISFQNEDNNGHKYDTGDTDSQNVFDTIDVAMASNHATDKNNPIINKRILLKMNSDQNGSDFGPHELEADLNEIQSLDDANKPETNEIRSNTYNSDQQNVKGNYDTAFEIISNENNIFDKIKLMKQYSATAAIKNDEKNSQKEHSNQGRIVVYGDSNCLDSTHIEKPCFWLLDAILQYTMNSHVSKILKDLNRSPNMQLSSNPIMPKRLPNNNLHLYSKVLSSKPGTTLKRPIPKCTRLIWDTPIFLNINANDFHALNGRNPDDIDGEVGELNPRRKLESQKGEVCVCVLF